MKTRISAMIGLLCVLSSPLSASAGTELPNISSGTIEPYISFMAGVALPFSEDATFRNGDVDRNVDYQMKQSIGGNAGIWFPTRSKLVGFDLGVELTGFVWYPDVACCTDFYNNDPTGSFQRDGIANRGTTTEISAAYVGANFLLRYPMAISEAYPNGRWFPYVGIGVGAHQLGMKPGGARGQRLLTAITTQRDTTVGFLGIGGIKAHLFKYVSAFVEAKYVHAQHNGLSTDRYGNSPAGDLLFTGEGPFVNPYESTVNTIMVHGGLSMHFDWKP